MIYNPHAAAGRAARLLPDVRAALEEISVPEILLTSGPGEAIQSVADTDLSHFDGLVAAGGDGTLFEVLNGLYRHDLQHRIPLGMIPVGTGNAFARDLGLMPGDWRKSIDIIAARRLRSLDVGRVNTPKETYYFLNIVGAGLPVDAMYTSLKLKFIGNFAYTLATLWQAMRLKSHRFDIEIDGVRLEQQSLFVEVSNTRYTGTSFLIAPGAKLDDGLLDLTLVRKLSRPRLLRLFPTIYKGRHVHFEEVMVRQAREIRIHSPGGLELAPDGEIRGITPATISCLSRDLEIFT